MIVSSKLVRGLLYIGNPNEENTCFTIVARKKNQKQKCPPYVFISGSTKEHE